MEYANVAGENVPALGLGTYKLRGQECTRVVRDALEMGYRHVDTAEFYDNQAAIGDALEAVSVDRDEIFLTTKIWKTNLEENRVHRSVAESIDELGVDYVDLLLIHWPSDRVPIAETIGAMNRLQSEGKVRHVGVSNFSVSQLREAMDASATPIVTDQVEYHPYTDQRDLLEFCIDAGVTLTAYSPLAKGRVVGDDALEATGDRYGKTSAQVALRWLVQQDPVVAIPKAGNRDHLRANLDIFDFELTDEEMERIFELQGGLLGQLRDKLGL